MSWHCNAIDSAVTILPNGRIAPCCVIKNNYSKDISELSNPDRFQDLKGPTPKFECQSCVQHNRYNLSFNNLLPLAKGIIQFIDFRNSNVCTLKCRTCGPTYSSSWAEEMGRDEIFVRSNVDQHIDKILTDHVSSIYFAGGEPLMNPDHWSLLEKIDRLGMSSNVALRYSTSLTMINYKNIDARQIWEKFKRVDLVVSVDATETAYEYIRSNASWETLDKNLSEILDEPSFNLRVSLSFTMSIINVWFLKDVIEYAKSKGIPMRIVQVTDPHYFALNVMPDEFVEPCVKYLNECKAMAPNLSDRIDSAINTVRTNDDAGSFAQLISAVLMGDKIRNEKLFDLLPFKNYAMKRIFENQ